TCPLPISGAGSPGPPGPRRHGGGRGAGGLRPRGYAGPAHPGHGDAGGPGGGRAGRPGAGGHHRGRQPGGFLPARSPPSSGLGPPPAVAPRLPAPAGLRGPRGPVARSHGGRRGTPSPAGGPAASG